MNTEVVKQFIEQNISMMEYGDWKSVFQAWYDKPASSIPAEDREAVSNLIDILLTAGFDKNKINKGRDECIFDHLWLETENLISDTLTTGFRDISYLQVVSRLSSQLGYGIGELYSFLKHVSIPGLTARNYSFHIEQA